MKVALARRTDLSAVIEIGASALVDAYRELLRPATVQAILSTAYTLPAMHGRWEDHPIFVARSEESILGFADGFVEDDRVVISALCIRPELQRKEAGAGLVDAVGELAATLPLTVDVILGDRQAETFYEELGFVPGETLEVTMFGEKVVERRWYRAPLVESSAGSIGASRVI